MNPRRGLAWPIILIAAGLVFLLANFGYIPPFSIGRALSVLWPIVLVLIGLDLAFSRRAPGLALALQLLAVAGGVGLVLAQPALLGPRGAALAETASVPREGATSATLRLDVGAARLVLRGGATALLEARSASRDLDLRVTRSGDRADIRLSLESEHFFFDGNERDVEALVASDIPLTVRVESGAGDFTIDLEAVRATDVRIDTGASSTTLVLPKPVGDVPVRVQAGAASLVIEIPRGVEAKVSVRGGLIDTSGPTETAGYAVARDRVTVTVEAGASSISIRQR